MRKLPDSLPSSARRRRRVESLSENRPVKLTELYDQVKEGKTAELRVILKADVQGSLGAIQNALLKLNEDIG